MRISIKGTITVQERPWRLFKIGKWDVKIGKTRKTVHQIDQLCNFEAMAQTGPRTIPIGHDASLTFYADNSIPTVAASIFGYPVFEYTPIPPMGRAAVKFGPERGVTVDVEVRAAI